MKTLGMVLAPIGIMLYYLIFRIELFTYFTLMIIGLYMTGLLLINKPMVNRNYVGLSLLTICLFAFVVYSFKVIIEYDTYVAEHIDFFSYTPDLLFISSSILFMGLILYLNYRAVKVHNMIKTSREITNKVSTR